MRHFGLFLPLKIKQKMPKSPIGQVPQVSGRLCEAKPEAKRPNLYIGWGGHFISLRQVIHCLRLIHFSPQINALPFKYIQPNLKYRSENNRIKSIQLNSPPTEFQRKSNHPEFTNIYNRSFSQK